MNRWKVFVETKTKSRFCSFFKEFETHEQAVEYAKAVCQWGFVLDEVIEGEMTIVPSHHVLRINIEKIYREGARSDP